MAAENIDMNDVRQRWVADDPTCLLARWVTDLLACLQDELGDLEGSIRMVEFEANNSGSDEEWLEDTADTATLLRQR